MLQGIRRFIAFIIVVGLLGAGWLWLGGDALVFQDGRQQLTMSFLQTKNDADLIVLSQGKSAVVIDTGEAIDGPRGVAYLNGLGVEEISYLILTHPDSDHIDGVSHLVESFEVKQVFAPAYDKENPMLAETLALLAENQIPVTSLRYARSYIFGDATLTIYPPLEKNYKEDNNYSLGVLLKHGDSQAFFGGDALAKRAGELLQMNLPQVDVYKVAHHGRANTSSALLMEALSPGWAVVTADSCDSAVRVAAGEVGAQLVYTGQGSLIFVSDGDGFRLLQQEPSAN